MLKIAKILGQRLALGVVTLFVVSLVIFLAIELLPGDVATEILGQSATPETVAAIREQLGLDQPFFLRYLHWLGGAVQLDFGTSLASGREVSELIGRRLANTLFLAAVTAAIAVPLSLALGMLAALYRNSPLDRLLNAAVLGAISMPEFFVAYVLILYFAVRLPWFPSLANVTPGMALSDRLHVVVLPAVALTLVIAAHMMRMTRAAIINLLASPYIEMAMLKGLPRWRIIFHHALPNAWAPIVNVIVINLAYLISGVVVVEVVFVYPGLGQLMVDSVAKRDLPVVQACSIIFAATYVLLNLSADVVSIITNPRLLHPR
ncbi:ABC transporter permease [Aurantimonas sp. VKM B-3413]|uniref:ABC transporter permease n=1 Tax=Aurantimonas sp. VKM B-3413 TaxID=2779401 RepID=UPI001E571526|nr:ABC transporter permease [Aurantimonas sp. VKM B-3413]MCB8838596.1 ABC transporter permease [Aurantimonas sp. VKM B-3413]